MADQQYEVGVRLKGDGSGLVGETRQSTDAMRQLEDQAKRTSGALGDVARSNTAARTEGTAAKQVLDAQREAMGGLTRETGAYTSGTMAATAAAAGLRGVVSGVLGVIGGPAGIITLLGAAALAWVGFGDSATKAAEDTEAAAKKSARAIAELTAVQRMQAQLGELYSESAQIRERMTSREMAARAMRGAGISVPVDRANEADAARLAAVSQQLADLQETMGKWLSAEWEPKPGARRRESREELDARREIERLKKLEVQSAEADLRAQHAMIEANDVLIRQAALRAREERERGEAMGAKSWEQDLLAQERAMQQRDEIQRRAAHRDRDDRLKTEKDIAEERERQLKRVADEQQRMVENLERSLTDATVNGLIAGFRRGEDALENFINRIEEMFLAAVFTPIIQPLMRPVAMLGAGLGSSIAGAIFGGGGGGLLGGGSASAGGTAGGFGGMFGGGMGGGGFGGLGGILNQGGIAGMGSQFMADFGNFFGNIGSITESGSVFGAWDAFSGFAGANPWLAAITPVMQLLGGNTRGALASAGLAGVGALFGGPAGALIGSAVGGLLGIGGGNKDRRASSGYVAGFGEDLGWGAYSDGRYLSGASHGASILGFSSAQATAEQNLIRNLNLRPEQLAAVNERLRGNFNTRYGLAEGKDSQVDPAALQQIAADRLNAISAALGRSIEELTQIMSMSAEQWRGMIEQMEASVAQAEQVLGQHVRGLRGTLGITGLEDFQRSLGVAEFRSPLDRLGAARGGYEEMLARARGGDLDAVRELPRYAQELLGIGRDTYASGAEFQDILGNVERSIAEVRSTQESLLADITKDISVSVIESSQNQIAAIRDQTDAMVKALNEVKAELERQRRT